MYKWFLYSDQLQWKHPATCLQVIDAVLVPDIGRLPDPVSTPSPAPVLSPLPSPLTSPSPVPSPVPSTEPPPSPSPSPDGSYPDILTALTALNLNILKGYIQPGGPAGPSIAAIVTNRSVAATLFAPTDAVSGTFLASIQTLNIDKADC